VRAPSVAIASLLLGGCGLILGLESPTLAPGSTVSVEGEVSGLWTGAVVGLRLRATGADDELLSVPSDGAFAFQAELAPGTGYVVSLESVPAAHQCVLEGAAGAAGSPATPLRVRCEGPPVTVELEAARGFTFDPHVTSYTLDYSVVLQQQAIRVSLPGGSISLDGTPLAEGVWSPPIALGPAPVTVTVALSVGGISRELELTFRRGGAALAEVVYGKASNPDGNDQLGMSIAISGDTVVVGAPGESSDGSGELDNSIGFAGAVYVFRRTGATWAQEAYLKAPIVDGLDRFGDSVGISGDTLVVGAPQDDSAGSGVDPDAPGPGDDSLENAGAVHVFHRTDGVWTHEAYLKAWNPGEADQFGYALAIAGDTIAVGTLGEDNGLAGIHHVVPTVDDNAKSGSGAVYLFRRSGATWVLEAYVKASHPDAFDGFGTALALTENLLVVGAPSESSASAGVDDPDPGPGDNSEGGSGAAFVFSRSGTTWSPAAYLKAETPHLFDHFGDSVAISPGNVIAVGATGAPVGEAAQAGVVTVFDRDGGGWAQRARVISPTPKPGDRFGNRLAIWRDILLVGAYDEDSAARGIDQSSAEERTQSGAAYVFRRDAAGWAFVHYVKSSNSDAQDTFGYRLALSDDTAVVSAPGEAGSGVGINNTTPGPADNSIVSGAFYLFH
jgi:FG-GAP repeat